MTLSCHARRRFLRLLPLALSIVAVADLKAQTSAVPSVGTTPSAATAAIIPLPLMPIIPPAQRVCASRTPTGLGYTVLRATQGAKPPADATVLVNYIGYLSATGAVFDQGTQTPMPVGAVIPGFSQGLQMLSKGSILRLCIPAALGYGAQASDAIPANSDLVFQVELLDFKTAAEIDALRKAP